MTYIAHAIHTTCAQGVHGTSPKNVDMQSLYIYLKVVDLILKNIGLDPNYKGYVLKRREKNSYQWQLDISTSYSPSTELRISIIIKNIINIIVLLSTVHCKDKCYLN